MNPVGQLATQYFSLNNGSEASNSELTAMLENFDFFPLKDNYSYPSF